MPSATFYDGVGCIGGTKILLSEEDSHIFLEFGVNFRRENQYFDWPTVTPQCLEDYLKTDLLPRSHELYDISVPYRWFESETGLDGVLVSHAHLDHYGTIPLFEKDTRVLQGKLPRILLIYGTKPAEVYSGKMKYGILISGLSPRKTIMYQ